ncbi:MAG: InlB B-repeat-containing protein [Paludibacteraceae bacterium]|nr:InlB B-repeat-containing protein [Paludibacteraceae bacterium]
MKKIYLLLFAALICLTATTAWADTVTKEDALTLAGSFFGKQTTQDPISPARKAPSGTTELTQADYSDLKVVEIPSSVESDYFYVIQNEGGGWVIMAADDAVQPILAYSETGTLSTEEMPDNLKWWLGKYNTSIKRVVEAKQVATDEIQAEWSELRSGPRKALQATAVVGPLLTTKWNQGAPYNNLCPTYSGSNRSATGCVATAMSQVMKYWGWPEHGQGSKSYSSQGSHSVNFANATYDWSNMLENYGYNNSSVSQNAVATLMYHAGVAVEMNYGASSGAQTIAIQNGNNNYACAQNALWRYFKYNADSIKGYYRSGGYGYSSWTDANWINMLKTELNKKHPIMYAGSGDGGGHSFVCDGYDNANYFHFNWGWGGSYDGYFTVNNLAPGGGGIGSNNDNTFNQGQDVIIGIVPNVSDKYKITYSITNGTCGTPSWTQSTVGQSTTLPNATPNTKYLFLGWSDREGSKTPNVGKAGDSYTPMRNITLYAVIVPDGYVLNFIPTIDLNAEVTELAEAEGAPYYWSDLLDEIPSWNGHGTCDVESLREEGTGAGIELPSANSEPGFTFQQWLYLSSSGNLYIAGYPGDRVYPNSNMNLYGYWTDDSKIWVDYYLTGVTRTSGPEDGWFTQADGLTATFVADEYHAPLAAGNTTVTVKSGETTINNCTSFANGVLTISVPGNQLPEDVTVTIKATETYSPCAAYTFAYAQNSSYGTGSKTLGAYTWNITGHVSNGTFQGVSSSTGNGANITYYSRFYGGNNRKCTDVTYTTDNANNCLVNQITIEAYCQRAGGTLAVMIGNDTLGVKELTASNAAYSFSNAKRAKGQVKFTITNATSGQSYSIYVKSINIAMVQHVDPQAPIKVNVDYVNALYLDYDVQFGDGQSRGDFDWYFDFYYTNNLTNMPSQTNTPYPEVLTVVDETPSMTTLTGSYTPWAFICDLDASTSVTVVDAEKVTFTYVRTTTKNQTTYYVYHVNARWWGADGQEYYIDSDVYADPYNIETGEDITPTGDTNARFYRVDYYQQNLNDNGYTLLESYTGQGESGATIEAPRNAYTGFKTPAAKSVTLANGNTSGNPAVVRYDYNRRTYPVSFVVNNITVQTDTLRYEAEPSYRGGTPEREESNQYRFEFAGWSPIITTVKQSATYTAQFNAIPIITVTFDVCGHGTAPARQTLNGAGKATRPADPSETGYTFAGWFTSLEYNTEWNFNNTVNNSITLYAKWTPNTHSLTWNANGGSLSGTYTSGNAVAYGTAITAPTATYTGYTFAGWGADIPSTMPDNDLSFTAQWTPNTNTPYVVKHYKQDLSGSFSILAETENLTGTTATNVTPARKSYTGFDAPDAQTAAIAADGNLVITYNYTRKSYELVWDAAGGNIAGNAHTSGLTKYEAPITAPANANVTKTGYNFTAWNPTPASTMPAANTTYTAQWSIKTYTIIFTSEDENKGTVSVTAGLKANDLYEYGDQVTINATPEAGYSFAGWSDGNNNAQRTLTIGVDVTNSLVANFSANTNTQYIVKFWKQNILDDEYTEQTPAEYASGTTGEQTNALAEAKVYPGFERLPFDEKIIAGDGSTVVNIYYNRLTFPIRFLNDGDELQSENLRFGATPSYKGAEPTKAADAQYTYSFKGWEPAIADVEKEQDYVATFNQTVNKYDISFDANGHGSAPATLNLAYGSKVTRPADLSETGYTFGGWFKEASCANAWDFDNEVVTGAQTLFAKWTINIHKVSWDANGGTITSTNHTVGNAIEFGTPIVAAVAEREHYTFVRWTPNVPATMPDNDLAFVAQWVETGDTPYEVHHFKQNLNNDGYTEVEEDKQELQGATGATVTPDVNEYEGFRSPDPQSGTILNDGSLNINYYYTRNSYNLVWNADGGVLVDNGYTRGSVKYEAPITAPADPTREGYTFLGWDKTKPATMPASDYTLNAQWQIISFTGIHFESNNTSWGTIVVDPQQDSYNYGDNITITANPSDGYHFDHWSDDANNSTNPRTVAVGSEVTSGFTAIFAPNTNTQYTIRHLKEALDGSWEQDGADIVKNDGITGESKTVDPNTYTGFRTPSAQSIKIAGDGSTVFEYKYERLAFKLSWDADGGEFTNEGEYTKGDNIKFDAPITKALVERTGYIFKGWNVEGGEPETKMPAHALAYKAIWEAEKYNNISFQSEDEEKGFISVDPVKNEYSYDEPVEISATANEGYTFAGWQDADGNVISTDATTTITITANTGSITAVFTANTNTKYIVRRFLQNIDDDNFTQLDETELTGTTGATVSPAVEEIKGFTAPEVQSVAIAGNGSTVIVYEYTRNSYNLVWDANGGNLLDNGRTEGSVRFGKEIKPAEVEWIGHIFKGWDAEIPETMPDKDLTLLAQWDKEQISGVTFSSSDENAGSVTVSPAKDTYEYGDQVTITATANEGYTFSGWSDGSQDGNPRTFTIDGDTTIQAIFIPNTNTKYVVRVFLQNIENDEFTLSSEEERTGTTGNEISPMPEIFEGFTAPEAQVANIAGNGSTVIEYRYIRNKYLLVWDANGGELSGEFTKDSVKFEAPIIAPTAAREGFNFLGWDAEVPQTMPASDLTLVAQWEEAQGIEIVLDGRTIVGPQGLRIYDFNGRDVTGLNGQLGSGLYIIVSNGMVEKIIIR